MFSRVKRRVTFFCERGLAGCAWDGGLSVCVCVCVWQLGEFRISTHPTPLLRRRRFGRSASLSCRLGFRRTVACCAQRCVGLLPLLVAFSARCASKDQRASCLRSPKSLDPERDPSRQRALRHPLRPRALLPRPCRLCVDVRPRPPRGRRPDGNWRERVRPFLACVN